jgi:hypothetical protein
VWDLGILGQTPGIFGILGQTPGILGQQFDQMPQVPCEI